MRVLLSTMLLIVTPEKAAAICCGLAPRGKLILPHANIRQVLPIAIAVMRVAPMIVIVAVVAVTVIAAVVAIIVIAAVVAIIVMVRRGNNIPRAYYVCG